MSGIGWEDDCIYQGMLMTLPNDWSKFGKNYRRRPSGSSYRSIAAYDERDSMTVSRIWNGWVQDGNKERRAGSQRPTLLTAKIRGMLPVWP
ncbi:hypothetical protein TNCV_3292081 [Trichonephila clavipes]|nr:hypothetical protein TNCV_3292081 [Trichonephila clavipes]